MLQFLKGTVLSLLVNALTVLGWVFIGVWTPAIGNVLLALVIVGIYGLEDRWAFPLGYWAVELLSVVAWFMGLGALIRTVG